MHQPTRRPPRLAAAVTVLAQASHVRAAGIKLATRGPIDVATVHVTFRPGRPRRRAGHRPPAGSAAGPPVLHLPDRASPLAGEW